VARGNLGNQILLGVLLGIVVGVFLGELSRPFDTVGRIYVALLQMTVLPYVTVSLITRIGRLSHEQARKLAGRAGAILLLLWIVSLVTVVVMPLSLPHWNAGTFFSKSLVESPPPLDFVELYVPTNPFHSLANNVVPAVVLFSILMGVAMISIDNKSNLLAPLDVFNDALGRVSNGVVRLSPWGTFALTAGAAGVLSPGEMLRLAGYVGTYSIAIVLLTLFVLPILTAMVTPYRALHVLSRMRSALLTALATGKLFAVLPMISSGVQSLLRDREVPEQEANASTDVLVPLAYPFPNAGKILIALFIPFSAWYVGKPLDLSDYPILLLASLLSLFGSPVAAIPFLLDLQRLPADLITLFLVAGIWCSRLGDVLGAMHLAVFTLLCDSWNRGWLRVQKRRFLGGGALILLLGAGALLLNHFLVAASVRAVPPPRDRVANMELAQQVADIVEGPAPESTTPEPAYTDDLDRVRSRGELRVGYLPRNPPFSYRNDPGHVVGLDIDLAQQLASNLGVRLRVMPVQRDSLWQSLQQGTVDIVVGGLTSSLDNFGRLFESTAYLELHAAVVVEDYRVKEFATLEAVRKADKIVLGYLAHGRLARSERQRLPNIKMVEVESPEAFLRGQRPDVDALLTTAEAGAIYSMLAPAYSVVVPEGVSIRVPVVFMARIDPVFDAYLDTWIRLKRNDGTIESLHDHWILGRDDGQRGPRWSVIRNVLGWVD